MTSKFQIIITYGDFSPPTRHKPRRAYELYCDAGGLLGERAFYERTKEPYGYSLYTGADSQVTFHSLELEQDFRWGYKGCSLSEDEPDFSH